MPYLSLIEEAWSKATDEQRRKMAVLLATMVDKLEAREREHGPLVVIHSPEFSQPTAEELARAAKSRFPTVHIHFCAPEDGQKKGTSAVKGA